MDSTKIHRIITEKREEYFAPLADQKWTEVHILVASTERAFIRAHLVRILIVLFAKSCQFSKLRKFARRGF